MASNFKSFFIDEVEYVFSVDAFKRAFATKKEEIRKAGEYCTADELKYMIADNMNVSYEAVRKWYKGSNGPVDTEKIKELAEFFGLNYLDLLHRKEEKAMSNSSIEINNSEKEVVAAVYRKIVEIIWLETGRYEENYAEARYQEDEAFIRKRKDLYDEAYRLIDTNSLSISSEVRNKLYNILAECKRSLVGMECAPGRWFRLNPLIFDAREYFNEGGFSEDEEERIRKLHDDAEGMIERQYYVPLNENIGGKKITSHVEGFHKDSSRIEIAKKLGIKEKDVELLPRDEMDLGFYYEPYEIYRYEFTKTILLVFQEDFPRLCEK